MRLQTTLILMCVLSSKGSPLALTLKCYRCIPGLSGICTDTQMDCSDQCASMTTVMNADGLQHERMWKICAIAGQCLSGSLNLGVVNLTINSQCCSTDLCNSQKVPALPQQPANGMKCYTCTENGCSETMSCKGDEDRCISTTVTAGGVQTPMKGCASRSLCIMGASTTQAAGITVDVICCEGDLCNRDEGVELSHLIMQGPLLSSILFLGTLCCLILVFFCGLFRLWFFDD
ncbi:hypothetical protein MHYP_G00085510 [Metynnis hypsauchen]